MDEPVPYTVTERGELLAKCLLIAQLEHTLRHFDHTSLDLHHYVRAVDGQPTAEQWQIIRE